MKIDNKNVIITGGSRGIGKEIALTLARNGANVIINYSNNETKALEVVEEIEKMGRTAFAIKADISDVNEANNLIKQSCDKFDKIDILINNAGITRDNLLMRMSEKEWDDCLEINLKGTFNVTKSIIRKMIKQKYGSIINISSVVGIMGNAGQSNYAASKAGIIGFSKSIAKEVGKKNIRVNVIAPGFIKTDMTDKLNEKIKDEYLKGIALNSFGEATDVANAALFLASDLSKYITGQTIVVDGGLSI
ncbi:3-oxoacyl-[acyl-carrier-protein] reductase [Senegalia massiliensis]|uniref:3-oxoacyl-[acyl-carrier-protein] reductase n=1 Tax=Senegalia massiliensis TaxID=1720316 RepID=A0A845QYJ5_9CLOT|nr:3-oxoacyl-[acyl-carrier-protein] reductase [Senegalia massiliensis]NBI06859.1 3-oxoacyl-[acyl-carrier-protein] reductase [Senegalia massiliensis]